MIGEDGHMFLVALGLQEMVYDLYQAHKQQGRNFHRKWNVYWHLNMFFTYMLDILIESLLFHYLGKKFTPFGFALPVYHLPGPGHCHIPALCICH